MRAAGDQAPARFFASGDLPAPRRAGSRRSGCDETRRSVQVPLPRHQAAPAHPGSLGRARKSRRASRTTKNGAAVRIYISSVFVDNQEKALAFYSGILGFIKRTEVPLGEHRWLTVV